MCHVLYTSQNLKISQSLTIWISTYLSCLFTEYTWKKVDIPWNMKCPLYAQVFEHLILSLLAQFWECGTSVHSSWDEFFLKEAVTLGQSQVCTLRLHFLSCHSASKNCIMSSLPDRLCTLKPWDISLPPSGCFLSSICSDTR